MEAEGRESRQGRIGVDRAVASEGGVIEEVVREPPSPRYRIRWDDGHESIYAPAAGALRRAEPTKKA